MKKKKNKATSNDTIVVSQALNETSVAIYSGCKWRTCESKLKYFAIICCPFPFPFRKKKKFDVAVASQSYNYSNLSC